MVLIIILIFAILTVIWFDRKKQSRALSEEPKKINLSLYNFLTVFLLLLAILQAPIFYFYTNGLVTVFAAIPYLSIALLITIILLRSWIKEEGLSLLHKAGVSFSILVGVVSMILGSETIEQLDWKYRRYERESIVKKAIHGDIKESVLQTNYFPPISNGGNEVIVESNSPESVTVTFFIDRGFLDHYTAFIYTTDEALIDNFDERIKSERHKTNIKMDENWYRIAE